MWKDSIWFALRQWRNQLRRVDFWLVFLFLICFFSITFWDDGRYVFEEGGSVGIFAVFGIALTDSDFVLVIFAGLLMIVCDLPVKGSGLEFRVLRSSRATWYIGQVLYSLMITVTYFFLVFLSQIIFYLPNLSPEVGWGSAVEEGMAFAGGSGIAFPDALLQQNVLVIFWGAFLLAILLGTLFSMICCSTNMIGGRGIGVSICGFLIIWQQICRANGVDSGMLSPVGVLDSYYQYDSGNIIPAVGYYVFLITVLLILGQRILYRIDMTD